MEGLDKIKGLQEWKTLLPRQPIVNQLLKNHGLPPEPREEKINVPMALDQKTKHRELQAMLPRTQVKKLLVISD